MNPLPVESSTFTSTKPAPGASPAQSFGSEPSFAGLHPEPTPSPITMPATCVPCHPPGDLVSSGEGTVSISPLGPGLMQGRPGVPFPTGTTWISRGSAVVLQIPSGPTAMYGVTPSNGFTVRTSSPPGVLWIVPSLPG